MSRLVTRRVIAEKPEGIQEKNREISKQYSEVIYKGVPVNLSSEFWKISR